MIDGQRESEQSWLELLLDAKARGLKGSPMLATGDGALGFWKALKQVYPSTRTQRCWVHKTVNVLDKLARGQPRGFRQSPTPGIQQQFQPTLLTFTLTVDHGDQFLGPICRCAH